ncbi:MAG: hypothetical protein IJX89_03365 [Alphaproteobacteria bacterium]|nr:hypothetical protein [Alphaproteobacteria bacterium]
MFSVVQWHRLARAELHGFPGFVFGILILAALPLYVATTTLVARTGESLIKIKLPKIKIPKFMLPTPIDIPEPVATDAPIPTAPAETPEQPDPVSNPLPDDMPTEMRGAFMRARQHMGAIQASAFDLSHMTTPTPQPVPVPLTDTVDATDAFPLPTDFDFDIPTTPSAEFTAAPTFTDIEFDTPSVPAPEPTPATSPESEYHPDLAAITDYLTTNNINFKIVDDIIITDKFAIATHSDPDFWVADTENWFAAGRVRQSPITAAIRTATENNCTPAIYLGATNIMELDTCIATWRGSGITVITDLSDLANL